jgi:hypothetical protein
MTRGMEQKISLNVFALCLAFLALCVMPLSANAQFLDPRTFPEELRIVAEPRSPSPGESVRMRLESETLDLDNAVIVWMVNDSESARGIGLRAHTLTAPALGKETVVEALVGSESDIASAALTFRSVELDLLWDSDSHTPPFYKGRSLPSAGSTLGAEAIVRFKRSDGSYVLPKDILYSWSADSVPLPSLSGRGKSSARVPSPSLFGSKRISVEARSVDGVFSGSASVVIPSVEPSLYLYMNHPLFGILYHRALNGGTEITDTEMRFIAVPLYSPVSPEDRGLVYEWSVGGSRVETDPDDPDEIILSTTNNAQEASIGLSLTHNSNWYLDARGAWTVTLGSRLRGEQTDPFRSTE